MKKINSKISGFTLIEMVVVIAVIGVLMTIAFRGTSAIQGGARDVKRVKSLNDMKALLEQYYAAEGKYPTPAVTTCDLTQAQNATFTSDNWGSLAAKLEETKIIDRAGDLQNDPTKARQYCYFVNSSGTDYRMAVRMERKVPADTVPDATTSITTLCGTGTPSTENFCVKP